MKVEDIQKGTKCKLAFNSELTEADYQEYIEAGVAYRRNTYRGKDITSKLEDGTLFSEIQSGHFDDIFVGDYIVDNKSGKKDMYNQPIRYLIADIDNYLNIADTDFTKHHATIIPAVPLVKAQMNSSDTTTGGYAGSEMVGYEIGSDETATENKKEGVGTLDTVLNTFIEPIFGTSNPSGDNEDHVITYRNLLTVKVDNTRTNRLGVTNGGASSTWVLYNRKLDLMSEMNVYGGIVWSSSSFDTGIDNSQYAIFKLKPEFKNSYGSKKLSYWLKDVAHSASFVRVSGGGNSEAINASTLLGVRPRFLID